MRIFLAALCLSVYGLSWRDMFSFSDVGKINPDRALIGNLVSSFLTGPPRRHRMGGLALLKTV
jgi:hypothetical protein